MEPMEVIRDALLNQIEILVLNIGEFYPFGILLDYQLATKNITTVDLTVEESIRQNRSEIEKLVCTTSEYHSGGYCVDTVVDGLSMIQLNFISKNSDGWMQFYLEYTVEGTSLNYGELVVI